MHGRPPSHQGYVLSLPFHISHAKRDQVLLLRDWTLGSIQKLRESTTGLMTQGFEGGKMGPTRNGHLFNFKVKLKDKELDVAAGQAIILGAGEWVQYSTPYAGGAEYIAVCLPAFSPEIVHREAS